MTTLACKTFDVSYVQSSEVGAASPKETVTFVVSSIAVPGMLECTKSMAEPRLSGSVSDRGTTSKSSKKAMSPMASALTLILTAAGPDVVLKTPNRRT